MYGPCQCVAPPRSRTNPYMHRNVSLTLRQDNTVNETQIPKQTWSLTRDMSIWKPPRSVEYHLPICLSRELSRSSKSVIEPSNGLRAVASDRTGQGTAPVALCGAHYKNNLAISPLSRFQQEGNLESISDQNVYCKNIPRTTSTF